jgi:hypothetical protein
VKQERSMRLFQRWNPGHQRASHKRLVGSLKNATTKRLTNGSEYAILPELQQTDAKLRKSNLPNELLSLLKKTGEARSSPLSKKSTFTIDMWKAELEGVCLISARFTELR